MRAYHEGNAGEDNEEIDARDNFENEKVMLARNRSQKYPICLVSNARFHGANHKLLQESHWLRKTNFKMPWIR